MTLILFLFAGQCGVQYKINLLCRAMVNNEKEIASLFQPMQYEIRLYRISWTNRKSKKEGELDKDI